MSMYTDDQRDEVLRYLKSNIEQSNKMIYELFGNRFSSIDQDQCRAFRWVVNDSDRQEKWLLDRCYYYLYIRGLVKQQYRLNNAQKWALEEIASHLPEGQAGLIEDLFGGCSHTVHAYAKEFPEKMVHNVCFHWMLDNLQSDEFRRLESSVNESCIASNKASFSDEPKIDPVDVAVVARLKSREFPVDPLPPMAGTQVQRSQGMSSNERWCRSDHDGYDESCRLDLRRSEEGLLTKEELDQEIAKLKAKKNSIGLSKSCPLSSLQDWLRSPIGTVGHKF